MKYCFNKKQVDQILKKYSNFNVYGFDGKKYVFNLQSDNNIVVNSVKKFFIYPIISDDMIIFDNNEYIIKRSVKSHKISLPKIAKRELICEGDCAYWKYNNVKSEKFNLKKRSFSINDYVVENF